MVKIQIGGASRKESEGYRERRGREKERSEERVGVKRGKGLG